MQSALIGYTGFVGSHLADQHKFDQLYNSKNYTELQGKKFDKIVCSGVSAVKWLANKDPEQDRMNIKNLQNILATVNAKQFILISTVDVYPLLTAKDENFDPSGYENHAYGIHRLEFENFCKQNFENSIIIRLPGLFGKGMKKNVIYDLLNNNCLDKINPDSSYQYYYLENLWKDISTAISHNLRVINLVSEPIYTYEIIEKFFPGKSVGQNPSLIGHYDLYTRYGNIFGKQVQYIYSRNEIMHQLERFINFY